MNIKKLPFTIQKKINAHMNVIKTLRSSELLEYSKGLKASRDITQDIKDYLFRAIDLRTVKINSGLDTKQECEHKKMVNEFLKGRR